MSVVYPNLTPLMGSAGIKGNNFLGTKYLFLIDADETIANITAAALEATYTALVANEKLIPLGEVFSLERADVEAKYEQGLSGESVKTNPELKAFRGHLNLNEDQAKQAFKIEGRDWRLIEADASGQLKLEKYGIKFRGFELLSVHVTRKTPSDSTVGTTTIFFQLADTEAYEQLAHIQPVDWALSGIKAINSVTATSSVVAANAATLTVTYTSPSYGLSDGTYKTAKITGLVAANIAIYSSAGVARASVTCTESTTNPGQYAIGATGFIGTDTVQVIPTTANLHKSNIVTTTA